METDLVTLNVRRAEKLAHLLRVASALPTESGLDWKAAAEAVYEPLDSHPALCWAIADAMLLLDSMRIADERAKDAD